jgi:hypothetical protein
MMKHGAEAKGEQKIELSEHIESLVESARMLEQDPNFAASVFLGAFVLVLQRYAGPDERLSAFDEATAHYRASLVRSVDREKEP